MRQVHEYKLRICNVNKNSKILVLREQGIGDELLYGTMYYDLLNKFSVIIPPYLHYESANRAFKYSAVFNAWMLMLLNKFVQIAPLEGAVHHQFLNLDAKLAPNLMQICSNQHQI